MSGNTSKDLLCALEGFFEELPSTVRRDLSFMMVALSDEALVLPEVEVFHELEALALFAPTKPIRRIGKLVATCAIFDVYFAMNARERFDCSSAETKQRGSKRAGAKTPAVRELYSEWLTSIETAKQKWIELRRATLSPDVIAAALEPPNLAKESDWRHSA